MTKHIIKDKDKRNAVLKHLIMYSAYFLGNVLISFVSLIAVQDALNVDLNFEDVCHSLHIVGYIVSAFSLIFTFLFSILQHHTATLPVKHIREYLAKIRKGELDSHLERENTVFGVSEFNPIIDDINMTVTELKSMQNVSVDFINYISHEFKTPLSVIQNYSKLLQADNLSDDLRLEYTKIIDNSVSNLTSLVTNALKLNQIEHQNIFANKENFNLSEEIVQAILIFENEIEEKNIELDVQLDENIVISSERVLSSHIWQNLISNAIKFSNYGGKVLVKTEVINDCAVVTIVDTGCGITEEDVPFVFDKYFRGNNSINANGNGLGLPLVKRICDALGMNVSFESELGSGTCFVITINL